MWLASFLVSVQHCSHGANSVDPNPRKLPACLPSCPGQGCCSETRASLAHCAGPPLQTRPGQSITETSWYVVAGRG
ncbi:uncharacterized protein BKA78DRAFT_305597 [Phyllosticta capitalensis]|uniref:uncharacterized protein n=1 Tax=Phyllosticta capitalensis TaxID=121624 RepID=UPI003130EC21